MSWESQWLKRDVTHFSNDSFREFIKTTQILAAGFVLERGYCDH